MNLEFLRVGIDHDADAEHTAHELRKIQTKTRRMKLIRFLRTHQLAILRSLLGKQPIGCRC